VVSRADAGALALLEGYYYQVDSPQLRVVEEARAIRSRPDWLPAWPWAAT
jgi:hypothetical protein